MSHIFAETVLCSREEVMQNVNGDTLGTKGSDKSVNRLEILFKYFLKILNLACNALHLF